MSRVRGNPPPEIRYRADIDGLRAVAVLLVVAFHMKAGVIPDVIALWVANHISHRLSLWLRIGPQGGFVGVDVFFVISGFLISGILLREQSTGTFSIVRFYERRVRRIFPALFALLLFVFAIGLFVFTPTEMVSLARSGMATTFSAANLYFWRSSGYFEALSYPKPLLHTWSLAVEEQFYLFFPVFLLLLHRYCRKHVRAVVIVVAIASLVICVITTKKDPSAAFYLPLTRAWELLLGTILALEIIPVPSSAILRNLVSVAGLASIVFAGWYFTESTAFPGSAALLPCLGAGCIIWAGAKGPSLTGRVLATRPLVFIGLISYSLYLWHWPLLLINNYEYVPALRVTNFWLFVVMLVLSALSWRLIEQPFRSGRLKLPRTQLFIAAAVVMVSISTLCICLIAAQGFRWRLTTPELRVADYVENGRLTGHWGNGCFASVNQAALASSCLTEVSGEPNYLLFGDSHAAHLWYGLTSALPNVHFLEATASKCKPLLSSMQSGEDDYCRRLASQVFRDFLPRYHVDTVILSGAWDPKDVLALPETIAYLRSLKLRVYVVGPSMIYDQPLPDLLTRAIRTGDTGIAARHRLWNEAYYQAFDDAMAHAAREGGAVRYLSLREALCPNDQCLNYAAPGVPTQFDQSHLTDAGSLMLAQRLKHDGQLP